MLHQTNTTELERELDLSRRKMETLISGIPGGVAIYRIKKDGSIQTDYVSEGLGKMCGYTADEFLTLIRGNALNNVREEDVPKLKSKLDKALKQNKTLDAVYHIHTKNGPDILNRLQANLMPDSNKEDDLAVWYAVHTKVSEDDRKAMREQEHYRMILNMTNIAYFEWDKEEGFYASDKFQEYALSQGGLDAVMGNAHSVQSIHPEDFDKVKAYLLSKTKNNRSESVVVRMKMTDGSYQYTEITGHVDFAEDGAPTRMTGMLRNVNPEWKQQNEKLQKALEEAENANRAKTDFLSRVSHDMRTPLNGVLGMARLAKEETDVKILQESIAKIESSGNYLLGLINDTLDFQKIESGRMVLEPHPVSTKEVVGNVLEMVRPTAEQKGVNFKLSVKNADMDCYVNIDPMRMKQIFMNLISNAIKFTPQGGTVDVCFECTGHDGTVAHDRITVSDTGIGMSQEFIENGIFRPFSQEYNETTVNAVGSGLGLSIVKKLVELMGGTITVESELGVGTTFIVLIDFVRVDDYVPQEKEKHQIQIEALKGMHVLLAEDHPLNAEIASRILANAGCVVTWAKNGQECVEDFSRDAAHTYDIILMDVRMPVLGGLEATEKLRSLDRTDAADIPIVAMTANAYEEDVKRCLAAGMNGHLAKPIDPEELYRALDRFVNLNKQSI